MLFFVSFFFCVKCQKWQLSVAALNLNHILRELGHSTLESDVLKAMCIQWVLQLLWDWILRLYSLELIENSDFLPHSIISKIYCGFGLVSLKKYLIIGWSKILIFYRMQSLAKFIVDSVWFPWRNIWSSA